ncbi:MAG: SpoIID/LytB domain-containing protein [Deltaproteobacteria bacterium]|nr:SpoIID/LytB domain-containing protein [Deltaproteobacteria bacterium]
MKRFCVQKSKGSNRKILTLCCLICLIVFLPAYVKGISSSFSSAGEKIKIAVLKNETTLKIEGAAVVETDGRSISPRSDKPLPEGFNRGEVLQPPFSPITIALEESGALIVNNSKTDSSKVVFSSDNDMLYLNGRKYRGKMEIIKEQKGLLVINELPLEFYVAGLINHEISSKWHMEVVKTQAVIARTYAIYQKKKRNTWAYHVESTVADQVYAGSIAEDDRSLYAVKETAGEVLTYNGEFALTVYHSNGGGMTEDSKNVWGGDYPYLKQVKSLFDKDSLNFSWTLNITSQSIESALKGAGYSITDIKDITPLHTTNSGRVTKVIIYHSKGDTDITGEDLRKAVGYDKLKSTIFTVQAINGSFVFNGKGSGHGVGLSQWGAKGMAEKGYRYRDILEHFYPGTRIERIY